MTRIEKALAFFKGVSRCQIIEEYCPFEMDGSLEDYDANTYCFFDDNTEKGCRGITCEECWNKVIENE